ncbi:ladinin-1 [Notechis scutatus]|uniref:Ladinin-1 n=1 Tax=Notechis scutatus TaxID=8663 RepID=A0A6J1V9X6_9SAUR|nr:ladinin-1 [Notechis scutatus]
MSFNRKNWSALSSLAQQWSVEDGEEQERERRRRHRQLSSTSETKEEESSSSTVQKVTSQTPNRVDNSLEAKLLNLENSARKNEKIEPVSVNKLEGRRVRRRAEFLNNIKQEKKILVITKKFEKEPPEENPTPPPESSKEEGRAEKYEAPIQQKGALEESPQIQSQKKEEIAVEKHEATKHVKDLKTDEDQVFKEEEKVPSVCESQRLAVTQNEVASQEPQRVSWERKSISRLEVKIQPRARKFTDPAVATPASEAPQVTERAIPKLNAKTIRSPSGQEGFDAPILISEPRITYSSSFNRISPRTISFRVVPRKERHEDALNRRQVDITFCNSFAIPLYSLHSCPIFVIEGQTTTEWQQRSIYFNRKCFESLRIPGGVSSRINLWISRTQESKNNEGVKDVQRTGNTIQGS